MQIFGELKLELCGIRDANEMRFPFVSVNNIRCDSHSSLDSIRIGSVSIIRKKSAKDTECPPPLTVLTWKQSGETLHQSFFQVLE